MRRFLAAFAFLAGLLPALAAAQAPPAVPALPDATRSTSYSITATTCACSVGFAIYGDGTDVDAWLRVTINGTAYLSTDTTFGWTITSATGSIATIPRPITNAVLTFNAVHTGTVVITGQRRPRRTSQFNENRGVAARDLNQTLSDIIATERELFDKGPIGATGPAGQNGATGATGSGAPSTQSAISRASSKPLAPLIVFAGESNSGGDAANSSASFAELQKHPRVRIFNLYKYQFEDLHIGANNLQDHNGLTDNATHGWELELANQIEAGKWGSGYVYLLKTGQGGSSIANWTVGNSTGYFEKFRERVVAAMEQIRATGRIPVPVIWYSQGVNDRIAGTVAATWETATKLHFNNLRGLIGSPVPIIMTEFGATNGNNVYNTSILDLVSTYPLVYAIDPVANGADAHLLGDGNHWDYAGMKLMADSMQAVSMAAISSYAGIQIGNLTWDRLYRSQQLPLFNNDYQAANTASLGFVNVLGTVGRNTGKYYFELNNDVGAANAVIIGLAQRDIQLTNTNASSAPIGSTGHSVSRQSGVGGDAFSNVTAGTALGTQISQTTGHYNMVAVDLDAGKIWLGTDNVFNGNPGAGTNPWATFTPGTAFWYPAATPYTGVTLTLRGESTNIVGTLPTGFSAWGTFDSVNAPSVLTAPNIYGTRYPDRVQVCNPGVWDGSPTLTFAYQWQRDAVDIPGATESHYFTSTADSAHTLGCVVSAMNAVGSSSSTATAAIVALSTSVWDAGFAGAQLTFSNGNLDVSGGAAFASTRGTIGRSTGKFYFEVKSITQGAGGQIFVGIADDTSNPDTLNTYIVTNAGVVRDDGVSSSIGFTFAATSLTSTVANQVIGVAVDMTAKKAWFSTNNVWDLGDPATGATPSLTWTGSYTIFPATAVIGAGTKVRLQPTSGSQTYAPPAGFAAWN